MDRICFTLFGKPIYWYGVMIAAGFLLGLLNWAWLGRRQNRPRGFASELGFWLMLAGIVGSRIAYVAVYWPDFRDRLLDVVRIDNGGLMFFGGFLLAIPTTIVFSRLARESIWSLADYAITAVPLAHAIGRIGCFLNGCCYGRASDIPWAVHMEGADRHPVQLYESAVNFAIYALLLAAFFKRRKDGMVFAIYLLLYAPARFILDYFRGDSPSVYWGFTGAQWVAAALFAFGAMLLVFLPRRLTLEPGKPPV